MESAIEKVTYELPLRQFLRQPRFVNMRTLLLISPHDRPLGMGEDAASVDQQLVREHGKVAIVGGRAAGITAAAALAKAAPALQKIDLFEARGLKRTSALLNRVGAFVISEADQNLNRNAIVTKNEAP